MAMMAARLVGMLVAAAVTLIGVVLVFNVNGAAQALIEQQRRQSYMRLFPWATSEVFLRIWAAVLALVGGAVVAVVLWAQLIGR